jgi:hypothetical protein
MAEWTEEPWERFGYIGRGGLPWLRAKTGTDRAGRSEYKNIAEFVSADDAGRAVACVNALAGIPTARLASLGQAIKDMKECADYTYQRLNAILLHERTNYTDLTEAEQSAYHAARRIAEFFQEPS